MILKFWPVGLGYRCRLVAECLLGCVRTWVGPSEFLEHKELALGPDFPVLKLRVGSISRRLLTKELAPICSSVVIGLIPK